MSRHAGGRPRTALDVDRAYCLLGQHSRRETARRLGVSVRTLMRRMDAHAENGDEPQASAAKLPGRAR